jgi:NADH-ubiquinone oxidoreductase chain 5
MAYTVSYKAIDRGAFEIMGPAGLSAVISNVAHKLHKAQTGSLYHYTLSILAIVTSILTLRQVWLLFEYDLDYRAVILLFISLFFILSSKK